MVSLTDKLRYLFPNANPLDFGLRDDGDGPYIDDWRVASQQPTQVALDALDDADVVAFIETSNVPKEVSMRQAREILIDYNLIDTISATIAGMDSKAQNSWAYSKTVCRDNALVATVTSQVGMTEAEVNQMFIEASQLP